MIYVPGFVLGTGSTEVETQSVCTLKEFILQILSGIILQYNCFLCNPMYFISCIEKHYYED